MIKGEQFLPVGKCTCNDDACYHELYADLKGLNELSQQALLEVVNRLTVKHSKGKRGWDDETKINDFKFKLDELCLKKFDDDNLLDIICWSIIIRNLQK